MNSKLFFVLLALFTVAYSREIEIENFQPDSSVKSDDFFDFGTLRLKKNGKNNFTISGDFELLQNCGNEKEIVLEVRKKDDSKVLVKSQDKFCDFLKSDELVWPDVQAKSNFPEGDPCPLPKGKYSLKDYTIDEKKFAMVGPGDYIGKISIFQNDEILFAVNVNCKVKP